MFCPNNDGNAKYFNLIAATAITKHVLLLLLSSSLLLFACFDIVGKLDVCVSSY